MKMEITESIFCDQINDLYPNAFSYDGLRFLYDFLEALDSNYDFDPAEVRSSYD